MGKWSIFFILMAFWFGVNVEVIAKQRPQMLKKYENKEYGIFFKYPNVLKLSMDRFSGAKISFPNERKKFGSDTYIWVDNCDDFPTAFRYTKSVEGGGGFNKVFIGELEFIQDIHEESAMGQGRWKVEQYAAMKNGVCVEVRSDDFKAKPDMGILKGVLGSFSFQKTKTN